MGELEIRPALASDDEAIVAAMEFELAGDAGERARRLERRRWAYADGPLGSRSFVALEGEQVVAHYGALPTRVLFAGEEISFAQPVDSFAVPAWRGRGAFVQTARAFFATHAGHDDLAYYGWPVPAAWRAGRRHLDYDCIGTQLTLVRELTAASADRAQEGPVRRLEQFDERILWLFHRCAEEFGLAAVRDADSLGWRLSRPGSSYETLVLLDDGGQLRGLAVWTLAPQFAPGAAALVEWLVPGWDLEAGDELLEAVEARAAARGARSLLTWLPTWASWFREFQARGHQVHPSPYVLAVRSCTRRLGVQTLAAAWWRTMLDSDLV